MASTASTASQSIQHSRLRVFGHVTQISWHFNDFRVLHMRIWVSNVKIEFWQLDGWGWSDFWGSGGRMSPVVWHSNQLIFVVKLGTSRYGTRPGKTESRPGKTESGCQKRNFFLTPFWAQIRPIPSFGTSNYENLKSVPNCGDLLKLNTVGRYLL